MGDLDNTSAIHVLLSEKQAVASTDMPKSAQ